jgi:hypothetical protein
MNKALAVALFAAAGLVAGGCASDESKAAREARKGANPAPCPNVVVLQDASRAIEFDGEQRLEDVAYTAEVLDVESDCRYFDDKPIKASVKIDFAFGRGPKGADRERTFAYFVAVTRTDLEVIEKAEFTIPVEFGDEERVRATRQEIEEILIPRRDKDISGSNFEIVIGLALTPEQAIFNRSGKSLKFPELKK